MSMYKRFNEVNDLPSKNKQNDRKLYIYGLDDPAEEATKELEKAVDDQVDEIIEENEELQQTEACLLRTAKAIRTSGTFPSTFRTFLESEDEAIVPVIDDEIDYDQEGEPVSESEIIEVEEEIETGIDLPVRVDTEAAIALRGIAKAIVVVRRHLMKSQSRSKELYKKYNSRMTKINKIKTW